MAILKSKSLHASDIKELKDKLKELKLELMKLSSQKASKSVSNPGKIKEIKRSIAKLLTVINQKSKAERR
ncbi:50S ribosomal protein L29 [Candidatus Pacearchaeota archaeon ex4484_26]|nr:MAG: 50S ribosomal protein L29 [Candidatus Pacearchaeota archaeon ex4484_26]